MSSQNAIEFGVDQWESRVAHALNNFDDGNVLSADTMPLDTHGVLIAAPFAHLPSNVRHGFADVFRAFSADLTATLSEVASLRASGHYSATGLAEVVKKELTAGLARATARATLFNRLADAALRLTGFDVPAKFSTAGSGLDAAARVRADADVATVVAHLRSLAPEARADALVSVLATAQRGAIAFARAIDADPLEPIDPMVPAEIKGGLRTIYVAAQDPAAYRAHSAIEAARDLAAANVLRASRVLGVELPNQSTAADAA